MTIKEIRTEVLKMTQRQLADKLHIGVKSYSNKECGIRRFTAPEIIQISRLSNVDCRDITI